jgi:hypothetical protein
LNLGASGGQKPFREKVSGLPKTFHWEGLDTLFFFVTLCITIRQLFVFFARKFWPATGNRFITMLLRQKFSSHFFAAFFSSSYLLNFSSSLVAVVGRAGYLCG